MPTARICDSTWARHRMKFVLVRFSQTWDFREMLDLELEHEDAMARRMEVAGCLGREGLCIPCKT